MSLSDEELDDLANAFNPDNPDCAEDCWTRTIYAAALQAKEANRMRHAILSEIDRAPRSEPDRYEGDNHGDSESNACERSAWYKAQEWKKVLRIHD